MTLKYASGLMQIIFMVEERAAKKLLDNLYDTVTLIDSATGAKIDLEILNMDIEGLVLLGDDDSDDLKLA